MIKEVNSKSEQPVNLCDIVASNLNTLIEQQNITQKKLAEITQTSEATIFNYTHCDKNGKLPSTQFLYSIKQLFNISLDDFLTKKLTSTSICEAPKSSVHELAELKVYSKFCATYYLYYLDTSKYKGKDYNNADEAVIYGVLRIYNNFSPSDSLSHSCIAILGIKTKEEARQIKTKLESFDEKTEICEMSDYVKMNYELNAYYGDFTMTSSHAFLSLHHEYKDRALLILHRPPLNGLHYNGGVGTINSISRGREAMPTIQFMGLSRYETAISGDEIHHSLLLHTPNFKATNQISELTTLFDQLVNADGENAISKEQIELAIKTCYERQVNEILQKNTFRYGKISNRDDDEWYHAIKEIVTGDKDFNLGN